MARSLLKFIPSSSNGAVPISEDTVRADQVKEELERVLRDGPFSTGLDEDEVKVSFGGGDFSFEDLITVEFKDETKTEDVLQVMRELLGNPKVLGTEGES